MLHFDFVSIPEFPEQVITCDVDVITCDVDVITCVT